MRKMIQHGISKQNVNFFDYAQNCLTYLYNIGFFEDLVLVAHNEYSFLLTQV